MTKKNDNSGVYQLLRTIVTRTDLASGVHYLFMNAFTPGVVGPLALR